jgi:pyridoxal biosynthesis lyase PdxS
MNWEAISAVAEIIGVIAVVVSLGYVSVQIRQNTKVARAATRQAIAESTENLTSDLISNAEIAEIFVKHMNGEELSPVENLRLQARC